MAVTMTDLVTRPTVDILPHPLTTEFRDLRIVVLIKPGDSLGDLVRREWPGSLRDPIDVHVDGVLVAPGAWDATPLEGVRVVTLRAGLRGGDDSNPLRVIALIAVALVAAWAGPAAVTALGIKGASFAGAVQAGVSAAVTIAGNLLVNALIPPRLPGQPDSGATPDPAYSISGGANAIRAYEPMLLVLGRHRVYPDQGARAAAEFRGGEQYLASMFHFGVGDLDVGEIRLGETPLDSRDEVETQWSTNDGHLPLAPGNVDTIEGADLEDTTWVERRAAGNATALSFDFVGQIFQVENDGTYRRFSVVVEIEITAPGHRITRTWSIGNADADPVRRSYRIDVPDGVSEWTIRVRRSGARSDSNRVYDQLAWMALRIHQPDEADYRGQTRLAVRIRASGQISGRISRLSAIAAQKIPIWNGTAWTAPRASSNPAWLFRWFAQGIHVDGRLVAGAGLPPARIDDAKIKTWGAWCDTQNLECNHVLRSATTVAEVLTLIAQCGRASPSWAAGRLGVVYEDRDQPVSALVTPGNILAGSFEVSYVAGPVAEEVVCRFTDPDLDWRSNTVRRTMPGVIAPASSVTLTLRGVTSARQAAIECNLTAARQLHGRRRMSWEMGAAGLTAIHRGDVVRVTHALIDGGTAGRVTEIANDGARLALSRPVELAGTNDQLLLALPDGTLHATAVEHPDDAGTTGPTNTVSITVPLPAPTAGTDPWDPADILFRFYESSRPPTLARIVAVEPRADHSVRFEAIDEVAAYHAATTADLTVPLPLAPRPQPRVVAGIIVETLVRAGAGSAVEIVLDLTVAGDWRGGVVRASLDDGPVRTAAVLTHGDTQARWLSQPAGRLEVTVVPGAESAPVGQPWRTSYQIKGELVPPGDPSNVLIDVLGDGTRRFRWEPPTDPDFAGVEIRYAPDGIQAIAWDDMVPMHRGILTASPWETTEPPPGRWVFAFRSRDAGGRLSEEDVRIVAAIGDQRLGDALVWRCPSAEGWPGTITGGRRSDDGRDAIEGVGSYTWNSLLSWNDWDSWELGDGDDGAREVIYTTHEIDIGTRVTGQLRWQGDTSGDVAFEARIADTATALRGAAWTASQQGTHVEGRWLQLRWRLTGDGTVPLRLDHLCWGLHASVVERRILDAHTASWEGSRTGGRTIPVEGLSPVTDVQLTLQNVGAGASWELLSKSPPKVRIYNATGSPINATVDAVVRGAVTT